MIVKANVVYKDGKRGNEWFLVRFDHTPVKQVTKKHRRTGLCSIFYLTDDESYKGGEDFASRICGEKKKFFVTDAKIECSEKDIAVIQGDGAALRHHCLVDTVEV